MDDALGWRIQMLRGKNRGGSYTYTRLRDGKRSRGEAVAEILDKYGDEIREFEAEELETARLREAGLLRGVVRRHAASSRA